MGNLEATTDRALPQFRVEQEHFSRPIAIDLFNHVYQWHGAKHHDPLLPSRRNIWIDRHDFTGGRPLL